MHWAPGFNHRSEAANVGELTRELGSGMGFSALSSRLRSRSEVGDGGSWHGAPLPPPPSNSVINAFFAMHSGPVRYSLHLNTFTKFALQTFPRPGPLQ